MNKKSFFLRYCSVTAIYVLVLCSGCIKAPYDLAAVTGTVTLDGQPFTEGKVMFAPAASGESAKAGKPASGKLDSVGKYVLSTYGTDDGAIVGKHWITVIQTVLPNNRAGTDPNDAETIKFKRYKFPQQQTIVAGQDNRIDIALTSAMLSE